MWFTITGEVAPFPLCNAQISFLSVPTYPYLEADTRMRSLVQTQEFGVLATDPTTKANIKHREDSAACCPHYRAVAAAL